MMRGAVMTTPEGVATAAAEGARGATITRRALQAAGRSLTLHEIERPTRVVVVAPRSDLLVFCTIAEGQPASACDAPITALAEGGLPPGVMFREASLSVLGRAFAVPDGCRMVGRERILCPSGHFLDWREPARGTPEGAVDGYAQMLPSSLRASLPTPMHCKAAGVEGVGRTLTMETPAGTFQVWLCAATRGEVMALVMCGGPQPLNAAHPPSPCDLVFDPAPATSTP